MKKFPYTIGIELTGIPKIPFDHPHWWSLDKSPIVDAIGELQDCSRAHVDIHCLEVPSPKLRSLAYTRQWFGRVRGAMRALKIYPTHPDVVDGGGHIHVGIANFRLRLYIGCFINRCIYLPWVFSEPDEEGSCDNALSDLCIIQDLFKNYSVNLTELRTVELRFFGSALNWSEQLDHINFTFAFIRYVEKRFRAGKKLARMPTRQQMTRMTPQAAIRGFKSLLKQIDLPYSRYEKYVKRNLLPRWKDGRKRR